MTKAWAHTAPAVLRTALNTDDAGAGRIRVYAFEQQTQLIQRALGDGSDADVRTVPDGSSEYSVVSTIEADVSSSLEGGETVRVMSFISVVGPAISTTSNLTRGANQ